MGSFNVACSVSSISIGCGMPVAFFPLFPNKLRSQWEKPLTIVPQSQLSYHYCYFHPLCLPIFGEYDDYGGIENILEDTNTKTLESFFGISIHDIINSITGHRHETVNPEDAEKAEILKSLSGMFVHRQIYDALASSPAERYGKKTTVAENRVTEEQLQEFGFKRISEEVQLSIDPHHAILYRKDGFPFDVKWGPYGMAVVHQRHKEYYVFGDIKTFYPKKIKQLWHKMTGTSPEETFPDPENIQQPTSQERLTIVKTFKKLTGASLTWAPQTKDTNHHIFSLKKFAQVWEQFTGEELNIEFYNKKSQHQLLFEKLQKDLIEFEKRKPKTYTLKYGTIEEQREQHKRDETLRRITAELDGKSYEPLPFEPKPEGQEFQKTSNIDIFDPLGRFTIKGEGFAQYYQDWKYFGQIYRQAIIEGKTDLKLAFDVYHHFDMAMFSCNRFYFPAMNGEQCGNEYETRNLLMASLRIIDQELADRHEYIVEDMEWD